MQMGVIEAALSLLESAPAPGEVVAVVIEWPQPLDEAKRDWQPLEPPPIVARVIEQHRRQVEQTRRPTTRKGDGLGVAALLTAADGR
jgi:hypothetical protein